MTTTMSADAIHIEVASGAGTDATFPAHRWVGPLTAADEGALAHAVGPVLDVGCGPGRHVVALAGRGVLTLGIDITPAAIALARHAGAPVLERSIFDRVPGAGRWATALLLDGNVGIGGDPALLLTRVAALLRPGGAVLVELEPPGAGHGAQLVRLTIDDDAGPWFRWTAVAVDEIDGVACAAGFAVGETWSADGRWFARLRRGPTAWLRTR